MVQTENKSEHKPPPFEPTSPICAIPLENFLLPYKIVLNLGTPFFEKYVHLTFNTPREFHADTLPFTAHKNYPYFS